MQWEILCSAAPNLTYSEFKPFFTLKPIFYTTNNLLKKKRPQFPKMSSLLMSRTLVLTKIVVKEDTSK